jgi:ATP-dependent protease ClpP protease subunit
MATQQEKQARIKAHLTSVLNELQQAQQGRLTRQDLIRKIEKADRDNPRRLLLYIANTDHPASSVMPGDIVPLGDALAQIKRVKNLDLMIHTFGGAGETAEKIVEMCRCHCDGEFRVIVPNMAKSAGTLIALGADKIVLGYCSELGPIDPQIRITVGNSPQMVSAWTFIRARDDLIKHVAAATAKKEDPSAFLQQLAAIDPVFVTHCESLMTFAKKLGEKWIARRLQATGVQEPQAKQDANKVITFLSNVEEHITHGRLILARELKTNCQPPLDIIELPEQDLLWQRLWELYIRSEVFLKMSQPAKPQAKLFETADVSITLG